MGDGDLIGLYMAWLDALGRCSLRSIESSLRTMDRALELECGLPFATQAELVTLFARRRPDGRPVWNLATRRQYRARVNGFFTWAVKTGELDFNPIESMPPPRVPAGRPKPLSDHELMTVLEHSRGWMRLAVLLAGWAGLRCCEIAPLRGDDVTDQVLVVQRGKGGKPRAVPTHPRIWSAIADLPPGNLMESTGGRNDAAWLSRTAARRIESLGISPSGIHRLRHSCGTNTMRAKKNIRVVQEILGHASLASTQIYTDVSDDLRDAILALP